MTPSSPPEPATNQVAFSAFGFGVIAVVFSLIMFSAGSGARWWVTAAGCAVATVSGLTISAWRARDRLVVRPHWALAIAAVYLVASIAVVLAASRRHLLWEVVAGSALGATIGASALLIVFDLIRSRTGEDEVRSTTIKGAAVTVAGLVLLLWGMSTARQLLAAEGLLLFTVGVLQLNVVAGQESEETPTWATVAGLVALGQAIVFLLSGRGLDLSTGLGMVVWLLGIIAFKLGVTSLLEAHRGGLRRSMALVAALSVAGGFLLWVGAMRSNQLAVLLGFTVAFAALSCLGLSAPFLGLGGPTGWRLAGLGAVLAVAGFVATWRAIIVWPVALVVSLVLASIGAWFVFRGEGLVAIVLVGLVIVWGLADRTTGLDPDPNPNAPSRILALGDSYISGEGAPEFFAGTNDVGAARNECRRAPTAYPYLVAGELGMGLDFLACSGATTTHLLSVGQMPDSPPDVPGGRAQLANLDDLAATQLDAIDVVLVSIGGNDVGFSTIIQACLLPEDCNELEDSWKANVERLGPKLEATYRAIAEAVPDTPIVVVPYPRVLESGDSCALGLRPPEQEFVSEFIALLDDEITAAAARTGALVFSANEESFAENLLCDGSPATNHLHLSAPGGDWLGRYSPDTWVHGSMHPNPRGHRLIAAQLVRFLCREVPLDPRPAPCGQPSGAVPDQRPAESAADEPPAGDEQPAEDVEMAEAAEARLEDGAWVREELYDTLGSILVPAGLLLLGGTLFAGGLVIAERAPRALRPRAPRPRAEPEGTPDTR